MSLTAEQVAIRRTGVGASEVSAITRTSIYAEPIDVWLSKKGLADFPESEAMIVGTELEGPLAEIYARRTGRRVERPFATYRHADFEHVLASPDGIVDDGERGLEIKVVGERMAHHWNQDSIPDYVLDQVQQNMAVTGLQAWDVAALIGGTEFRIRTVEADIDHQATLLEACEVFWITWVEPDEPPETEDPAKRRAYLLSRYPGSEKTAALDVGDDEAVAEAIRWYREGKAALELFEKQLDHLENILVERIGDAYGIEGPWGKAINFQRRGNPKWKDIAEQLAGGAVPDKIVDAHRGEPGRTFRFYPFVPKRPGATKKGSSR